ncbi:hypothetical protein NLU13_4040 [Sarocladium strictum]|uniref:Zn(2)-C6 fungal-type domain-containing protein n=1 Tax=Sarocladium strictum TaxID=5046 RepID=A0AA39GI57_SARSR|nr:hypothetical protein NLU13_4040 [Sarocladium strictum]
MGTQSCQSCHRRKVRCDVDTYGSPCTNCRLDGRQCEKRVPLKRGRKSRVERDHRRNTVPSVTGAFREPELVYTTGSRLEDPSNLPTVSQTEATSVSSNAVDDAGIPSGIYILVPFYYHDFLQRPDVRHLRPAEVQRLEDQGALKVPSGEVLHEFIRHYFLYVHPCLPILNEASFWSLYSGQGPGSSGAEGISLALFQAMLLAASQFVQPQTIQSCGFENLKHARTLFHRRAELLLQNGAERDLLTLAQTSLLLSLRSTIDDQSLNSAWLTRAIQYAKQAGAHRYYDSTLPATRSMLEKKKLWWSCILRDRMIAVGVRRSIQITPDDFDFDQGCLEVDDFVEEQGKSQVYQPTTQMTLTRIIIAQCELAVAQTPALMAAYANLDQGRGAEASSASQLVTLMTQIERAKTELDIWARRFKTKLLAHVGAANQPKDPSNSVTLFADMTLIHYFSTLVALSNISVSVLEQHQVHLDDYVLRLDNLKTQLRSSITEVADRVKRLSDQGLAHHLPVSAPACTALPFILEALNHRLSPSDERSIHQRQLERYTKIMKTFRAQNDHTECVTAAVDSILQVVEVEISHMSTGPGRFQTSSNTNNNMVSLSHPSGWSDMLAGNPLVYVRLSLCLDFTLSQGKTPHVTDLPVWALGTAAALQAPSLSSSLHLMPPSISQNVLAPNTQSRILEIDDSTQAEMEDQWAAFNQTAGLTDPAAWSFADMDVIKAWFESC